MNGSIQLKVSDTLKAFHPVSASVCRIVNTSGVSIDYSVSGGAAVALANGASAVVDVAGSTSEISARRTDLSATPATLNLEFGLTPDESYEFATAAAAAAVAGLPFRNGFRQLTDSIRSNRLAQIGYNDATQTNETWADLTGWTPKNTGRLQVSSNALFAGATNDGQAFATRANVVAAGEVFKATFVFNYVVSPASGGVIIGIDSGAASIGGASACGLAFGNVGVGSNKISRWENGTGNQTGLVGTTGAIVTGAYFVEIAVDAGYTSVSVSNAAGTVEASARFARATCAPNALFIFLNDSRQLTGCNVGRGQWKKSLATSTPKGSGYPEGNAAQVQWGGDGTNSWMIATPAGYDARYQYPLAVLFHGNGTTESRFATPATNDLLVRNAFLAAGYVCLSANLDSGSGATWGRQASLDAYYAAYKFCRDNYNVGPVVVYGNSMGGLESLLAVAEGKIPAVAWVGTMPVCSLAWAYADATFGSMVTNNYGVAGDGSDYAAKTAGHDPLLKSAGAYFAVPAYCVYATDDTAVPPASNWTPFAALLTGTAQEVTAVTMTGGHSADLTSKTAGIVAFADKWAKSL